MKITIIDCGSTKVKDIAEMFVSQGVQPEIIGFLMAMPTNSDGVVISGAPRLLTEEANDEYLEYIRFIDHLNVPALGICFGHQLIGMHYGASISRCREDRNWQTIHFRNESELTIGFESDMLFMEDHCECISLPTGFNLIASSEICKVEMMQHKQKPIFGVQFHPEVSEKNGKKLFSNFIQLCNK